MTLTLEQWKSHRAQVISLLESFTGIFVISQLHFNNTDVIKLINRNEWLVDDLANEVLAAIKLSNNAIDSELESVLLEALTNPAPDLEFQVRGSWSFSNAKRNVNHPDFRAYALWLLDDLTDDEIETLTPVLRIWNLKGEWLQYTVANSIGNLLANDSRQKRIIKAIESGKCKAQRFPELHRKSDRDAVGAVLCELHHAGKVSRISHLIIEPEQAEKVFVQAASG
ncbi:hypothetical protein [Photobacterium leiognathi]|uniref:hypothetical protein n=1 Tax=Photobacterium leiognathi TaxID=553611 RepID=UPI002980EE6E|nr:hypothetical protein [Photobacterium leiognathi]